MTTPLQPSNCSPLGHENILQVAGQLDPATAFTELRLSSGEAVRIPTSLLAQHLLPQQTATSSSPESSARFLADRDRLTIPVIEERLIVEKRIIPKAELRLQKTVEEYQESLDQTLAQRTFEVERILLNQPVDAPPPIRQEGNTTVYSLVEEQLILTKQLLLVEEVRITQHDTETRYNNVVNLRREQLTIDRVTY